MCNLNLQRVLSSALPNRVLVTGVRYAELPDALRHQVGFAFATDVLGDFIGGISYPWAKLNNRKVTLSFKPATPADEQTLASLLPEGEITDISQLPSSIPSYLIYVVPELKIDGAVVKQGTPLRLGEEVPFAFSVTMPTYGTTKYQSPVIAGSYLSVAVVGGNVSSTLLTALQTKLDATKTTLESGDTSLIGALTREEILGDIFYAGTLGYFAQYLALSHISGLQQKIHHNLAPSMGTYGYEPAVDYFFGFPRAIQAGGVVMDIDRVARIIGPSTPDAEQRKQFNLQTGLLTSALEHAVPEQMFVTPTNPGEAISAVKAIAKASAQGQRIYHVTPANQAQTLPNINHNALTMEEIRLALSVGKEVITHTDAVSVPGWSGAGYIILDPETGDGAYKIGGGGNGSILQWVDDNSVVLNLIALGLVLVGGVWALLGLLITVIVALASIIALIQSIGEDSPCRGPATTLYSWLTIGFTGLALIFSTPGVGAIVNIVANFIYDGAIRNAFKNAPQCNSNT